MELEQIRALDAVASAGSLLGASRELEVGRARLRAQLQTLEAELGVKLLSQSPRGTELTEAGQRFLDRGRRLVREADALARVTVESQQTTLEVLRVCVPTGIPPVAVTTILARLRAHHPQMALHLATHPDPLAALDEPVDVFLHFGETLGAGRFRTFAIRRFSLRLMASPAYLDRRGRPAAVQALTAHDLLLWRLHSRPDDRLTLPGAEGLRWTPSFASTDCYVVRAAAEAGHGIALLPEALAGPAGWPGEPLEPVLPEAVAFDDSVRVLLPERTAATARARAVVAVLRALGETMPTGPAG